MGMVRYIKRRDTSAPTEPTYSNLGPHFPYTETTIVPMYDVIDPTYETPIECILSSIDRQINDIPVHHLQLHVAADPRSKKILTDVIEERTCRRLDTFRKLARMILEKNIIYWINWESMLKKHYGTEFLIYVLQYFVENPRGHRLLNFHAPCHHCNGTIISVIFATENISLILSIFDIATVHALASRDSLHAFMVPDQSGNIPLITLLDKANMMAHLPSPLKYTWVKCIQYCLQTLIIMPPHFINQHKRCLNELGSFYHNVQVQVQATSDLNILNPRKRRAAQELYFKNSFRIYQMICAITMREGSVSTETETETEIEGLYWNGTFANLYERLYL